MDPGERVCPYCGEPPGDGVFCAACGRNLAAVEQLPTRAEWSPEPDERPLADRCAEAVATFVDAMRAAGNPGAEPVANGKPTAFRRAPRIHGWILRDVDREDFEEPHRYEPGLFLTVDGRFHRLDSELRGWGQRNFPRYEHSASPEPIEMPASERLLDELRRYRGA